MQEGIDYKVIDNFLPEDEMVKLENLILREVEFPWYYQPNISFKEKESKDALFYMIHLFYNNYKPNSAYFPFVVPLINKLKPSALIRVKANFYPNQNKSKLNEMHKDYPFKHKGAIFSINTCNGGTLLSDKTLIKSVRNRVLLFDPSNYHDSTNCTDNNKARININVNYY
jgi:hypothetical protein|tara:strand:+ start:2011 stop:2520 length:510 start_codon:yes stop_codon:yes gene_type:complete